MVAMGSWGMEDIHMLKNGGTRGNAILRHVIAGARGTLKVLSKQDRGGPHHRRQWAPGPYDHGSTEAN